ncbi:response regulator [Archaeoglobales archaeon]|nr:MAG: response regulator [Archaeoglobales archaeon]
MKEENRLQNNKRILIVDHDTGVLDILRLMLSDYDCIFATDGEEAIKLYSEFKPTLVIMEIMLPKMDGIEVTKRILEIDPEAKIIGLTAFKYRWGEDLLKAGAIDVIEKPFRRDELLKIVEKYLNPD